MTVLTVSNAFLGIALPQHKSGQTSVRDYRYPGALQLVTTVTVLTSAMAFLGISTPQHSSGQSSTRNYLFPGALQPVTGPSFLSAWSRQSNLPVIGGGTF